MSYPKITARFFRAASYLLLLLIGAAACGGSEARHVRGKTTAKPVLVSISPASAFAGDMVTLTGTDFGTQPKGSVRFGLAAATVKQWGETSIVVTVPADAGNTVFVVSDGIESNALAFELIADTGGSSNIKPPPPPRRPVGPREN